MAFNTTHVMGKDCKLYRNTGTNAAPTWNEIPNVRDLTYTDNYTDVDISARDGGGFATSDVGLRQIEASWQMIGDFGDADFLAIQTAFDDRAPIQFAFATGGITTAGTQYMKVVCKVIKCERGEELDNVVMYDIQIKPTRAYESGSLVLPTRVTVT